MGTDKWEGKATHRRGECRCLRWREEPEHREVRTVTGAGQELSEMAYLF